MHCWEESEIATHRPRRETLKQETLEQDRPHASPNMREARGDPVSARLRFHHDANSRDLHIAPRDSSNEQQSVRRSSPIGASRL